MGRYCRHKKPKTAADIVAHFQRRCMDRIGFILKQRVLKDLKEKKLLSVLEKQSNIKTMYRLRREMYNDGKQMLQKDYGLSAEEAAVLFRHVWIFTFGLGALCATGVCCFSDEEINDLLGQNFMAMLVRVQSGDIRKPTVHPQLNDTDSD